METLMILTSNQYKALASLIETKKGFSNQEMKKRLRIDETTWSRYMVENIVKRTEIGQG